MNEPQTTTYGAEPLRQIRDTGRNLWLAGLGALGEIESEGRELFDRLVERGRPLEERQKEAQKKLIAEFDDLAGRAGTRLREVQQLVQDQVRYDVKRVLARVGLPTSEDVSTLTTRLEALSQKIDELAGSRVAAPVKTATAKAAPVKTTTQPRVGAKSAKKKG